jgi:simple sugar transport system permease protein
MSLILFVIVVVVFTILLQRKQYGMELYLVGTNPKSARFSGIKNERVILKTHVYGGILSAIAGIIIASGTNSAKASYGSSYVLRCLIVAILCGINPSGGFGKITGVVMAVLTIQFLSSGFGILRVDSYFQTFVWGAVLVGDMILNHYMDKLAENRKKKKAEKETAA